MDAKSLLSEMLDYYKYKVENNLCTAAEIESAAKVLQENMDIHASISDLAKFYDVSEQSVRSTINRKLFAKPVRKVYYPFHAFMRAIPDRWRRRREKD